MRSGLKADPSGFDPRCGDFRADPYPIYRSLRATAPIYRRPGEGDWLITRYRDVETVLKSRDFGRADQAAGLSEVQSRAAKTPLQKMREQSFEIVAGWTVLQNPPKHTHLRNQMRQFFNASHLKLYQEVAEDECRQRILALPDRGRTDLISEIAFPIAWRVNAAILGIEPKDFSLQLRNWTDSVARLTDLQPSFISGEQGLMAIAALSGYFSRLLAQPSSPGQPGLIQQLAEDLRDGGVGETDAMSTLIFMFAVGHSSTVNLIGNTILTLLRHPKEMALLSDPALLEPALSEVLRFESPVQSVTRTALVDTKVGDTVIKRGQAVHLIIAAANRDPEKFSDPDRFDIHRKAAPNLSFGLGIHTCIGLRLAKTTSLITLRYLLDRMRFELPKDDEPIWDEPYLGHGLKSLSVDFQKRH